MSSTSSIRTQHDRQIAGDALRPQTGLAARAAARWHPTARRNVGVGIQDAAGEALKQACLVGLDTEMVQLHLSLRPGQRRGALEGVRV